MFYTSKPLIRVITRRMNMESLSKKIYSYTIYTASSKTDHSKIIVLQFYNFHKSLNSFYENRHFKTLNLEGKMIKIDFQISYYICDNVYKKIVSFIAYSNGMIYNHNCYLFLACQCFSNLIF